MSTVLTKPVLLDETGQAIVGKLQDIQQAIGGTGEFIPINIRVTTPPTKTNYLAGEALDLSGMVVTLVANNGGMYDVTGDCVFSPADGSTVTSSTTEVNISYTWYKDSTVFTAKQPIGMKELASIAVTTPPTQTEYFAGDELDLTGIVVTAQFDDGSTANVTNDCEFSPADGDVLALSDSTINISYTLESITKTTTQSITIEVPVYGVEWDGTSTSAWTRTDRAADFVDPIPQMSDGAGGWTQGSSPFDIIAPWSGMEIVEDANGGTLVKIPKFYFKITPNGRKLKLQISPTSIDGFLISPAHADRGDGNGERDFVYVGRYHCNANFKSISGVSPKYNITRASFRTSIHNLGSDIWQWDYAMLWTIRMLMLVEFADWDMQAKIGYGCSASQVAMSMGYTDSMPYHTGTTATSRDAYGGTQYRYIEGIWDNDWDWVDGIYCAGGNSYTAPHVYCIKNPANFNDSSGGTDIGQPTGRITGGTISSWVCPSAQGFEYALFPDAAAGSDDTYICDYAQVDYSDGRCLYTGGNYNQSKSYGPYAFYVTPASNYGLMGSRLMKLPNAV